MQWGADADAKLFMHVLRIHGVKLDYVALAQAMGNDCTPKAITHRIAKLKDMAKNDTPSPSTGTPPKKRGPPMRNTPTKTPTTNKRTANGSAKNTPNPKSKATPNQVKNEPDVDESDDSESSMQQQQHANKKVKAATHKRDASPADSSSRIWTVTNEDLARGHYADGEPVEGFNI